MDFEIDEELEMLQQTALKLVRDKLIPLENKLLAHGGGASEEVTQTVEGFIEEMGLWGMNVPEDFEGVGLPVLGGVLVAFELGRTFIDVPVGDVTPLLFEGDEEQKKTYLEPVVERQRTVAVAFREADAACPTVAKAEGDGYVIDGAKTAGTAGEIPDFLIVFARTSPDVPAPKGTTAFLVDKDTKGLVFEEAGGKRVARFQGCAVPGSQVLGKPDRAFQLGRAWYPAARLRKAAEQLGAADRLVEIAALYARDWSMFGRPITERKSVQTALADSAAEIYAGKMMVYHAAWLIDSEMPAQRESMMAKLFVGQLLKRVVARTVEIHGGPLPHFRLWSKGPGAKEDHADLMRAGLAKDLTRSD